MKTVADRHREWEQMLQLQLFVDELQSVAVRLLERARRLSAELDRIVDELDERQPSS